MLLPQTYLTAGVEATTTAIDTTEVPVTTTDETKEVDSTVTDGAQGSEGTEGTEINFIDEEGNVTIQDPETGEVTTLTMEDLANMGLIEGSNVGVQQKEITGGVTATYAIYGIFCVILIFIILSQNKRSAAFGNGMSSGNGDTYWAKNKGRSKEGQIEFFTKIGIGIFIVATLIITLI